MTLTGVQIEQIAAVTAQAVVQALTTTLAPEPEAKATPTHTPVTDTGVCGMPTQGGGRCRNQASACRWHTIQQASRKQARAQGTTPTRKVKAQEITLGKRGNGRIARRSAHDLAAHVDLPQHEIAKLDFADAVALAESAGLSVSQVAAKDLPTR